MVPGKFAPTAIVGFEQLSPDTQEVVYGYDFTRAS